MSISKDCCENTSYLILRTEVKEKYMQYQMIDPLSIEQKCPQFLRNITLVSSKHQNNTTDEASTGILGRELRVASSSKTVLMNRVTVVAHVSFLFLFH